MTKPFCRKAKLKRLILGYAAFQMSLNNELMYVINYERFSVGKSETERSDLTILFSTFLRVEHKNLFDM